MPSGTFWPSPHQEQLLVAALADPDESIAAWSTLRARFSLDELEPGSFELMPLVYRNLSSGGHEDELLARLKGIYRKTWVLNNLLLEKTKVIGEVMGAAKISTMFLEGATFAARYYPDLGLRFTSSVDVLVDDTDIGVALTQLQRTGWSLPEAGATSAGARRYLVDPDGQVCALQSVLAPDFVLPHDRASSHAPLWDSTVAQDVGGVVVRVPAPTDALLSVCVRGARVGPEPNIQWLADASMILRTEDIDWNRLLEIGIARGQALRLRAALDYLSRLPGPNPPADVYERLAVVQVTPRARLAYWCAARTIRGLGALPAIASEHLAATAHESPLRALASLPRLLRKRWNLAHGWQLPLAIARRAIRLTRSRKRAA